MSRDGETRAVPRLSRRSFLAGSAAFAAARPALGQSSTGQATADVDVIIVGAGAAGIAAAHTLSAAGRSFTLVEATNRVGGRCVTETQSFGVPFDRGAHWIQNPDINPLTKLVARTGLDIYQAPSGQRVRIGQRRARESELEDYLAATVRANRAIVQAGHGRTDVDCLRALPKDLGDWRSTVEFVLGPYANARDLGEMSALDFSKSTDRAFGAFCRQGYGALLAKLADGIPVELQTPVTQVDTQTRGSRVDAVTPRGTLSCRYMIVTASTEVLASERVKFDKGLPKRHLDALAKLKLGSFDHIALELAGNPLGLQRDDVVLERSSGPRTAALLANVSGTPLSLVEVGGGFGRELSGQGEAAMVEFAVEWLAGLFGNDLKRAVQRTAATRWDAEPWALGAFASAAPGGQWARRVMMEPIRDRVYCAGEAVHETLWGTVGGAWESGARAAEAVVRRLAGLPEPQSSAAPPKPDSQAAAQQGRGAVPKPEPEPRRSRTRARPRPERQRSRRRRH
jgi:monoamine oxidase